MWKLLFQSVRGSGHETTGHPCQDRCRVRLRAGVLGLACADGAGSAPLSERGAQLACAAVLRLAFNDITEGLTLHRVDRDTAVSWYQRTQGHLDIAARQVGVPLAYLATTLLVALVGPDCAVFCQVGDGAIVVATPDGYRPVFWPQNGEYANTTNFLTGPNVGDILLFERRAAPVDELALFTDGLQSLSLTFADRQAHQPFFLPLFAHLRAAKPGANLPRALRQFLDSAPVRARSDDDKTLMLATRIP